MKHQAKAQALRVYISEHDQFSGGPLYAAIVGRFKELGVAGATVLRASELLGANKHGHDALVIESIDVPERIAVAVAAVEEMNVNATVTIEDVTAIRYFKEPAGG